MSYSSTWQSQQDIIMEQKKGGFNPANNNSHNFRVCA